MTLQEEHYKAIEDATAGLFSEDIDYLSIREKAAKDSTEITKQYMKGFEVWRCENWHLFDDIYMNRLWERKTLDEIIELYLTEKQSQ